MPATLERINVQDLTLDQALVIIRTLQESSYELANLVAAVMQHTITNEEGIVRSHPDAACPVRVACEMLVTLGAMDKLDDCNWIFTMPHPKGEVH